MGPFSSVQSLSRVRLFATPWTAAHQASLSITNSQSLLKLMFIGDAIQPSRPPSSPSPAFSLSLHQGLSQWLSSSYQMAKVSRVLASASVFLMNIQDWFPLGWTGWSSLLFKGLSGVFSNTIKSINSSALSFLYSPTLTSIHDYGKTIAFTRKTFVSKVVSLPFNMLSRLVITFVPRSKHLLISWLQSPSAVIFEAP